MKKKKQSTYESEPGEKALELLIKEAGKEARKRKKKAMVSHFQKLHAAIHDYNPPVDKQS